MAIKQRCVNISPCGGHAQDLVVAATKRSRSEVLASLIVSSQQPFPVAVHKVMHNLFLSSF